MTREEAIEYLKWARPKNPYSLDRKNLQKSIDIAIEALKPIEALKQQITGKWLHFAQSDECSVCGYNTGKYEAARTSTGRTSRPQSARTCRWP